MSGLIKFLALARLYLIANFAINGDRFPVIELGYN